MTSCDIVLRHRNLRLHWASARGWFASRGYSVWSSSDEGTSWTRKCALRTGWAGWCSRYPFLAAAGRLGIHNLICLSSGALICVADGVLFRSTDQGTTFVPAFSGFRGRRPLRMGICQDASGRLYLGEYWANRERDAVQLFSSDDDGMTWYPRYTWASGTTRHIHFVQFDPHEGLIWLGTGDNDMECRLLCSRNGGESFESVGEGAQIWRAVSVMFTPEAVFWATDIGRDHDSQPNYLVRWDRSTHLLSRLMQIDAPAYYSTQTADGRLAVGTAVEGGKNETDGYLRLYWSENHCTWQSIRLWPRWPAPGIFGPATIQFPAGDATLSRLLFGVSFVASANDGSLFEAVF
jgi:hypothetical protein